MACDGRRAVSSATSRVGPLRYSAKLSRTAATASALLPAPICAFGTARQMRTRPALFAAPLSCAFVRAPLTEETAQRSSATKRALILYDIKFRLAVFSFLFRSLWWIDETRAFRKSRV